MNYGRLRPQGKGLWLSIILALGLFLGGISHTKGAEPPSVLKVVVPDYQADTIGGLDSVDIPGGHILVVDGKPRVPYYSVSLTISTGTGFRRQLWRRGASY